MNNNHTISQTLISDEQNFRILKEKIIADGPEHLHVLADFDKTLTLAFVNGQAIFSIIAILRDGNHLTPDYAPISSD